MSAPAPKDSLLRARDCVANVRMLPPLPTVAVDIMSKLGDEFIDGNEVADVVAQDPAICARLISLANSAYFALRTPVCDMREVVNRVLGADTVRSMALALASQRVLDTKDCPAFDIREFWRVALGTAAAAKRIAAVVDEVSPVERDSAYAMGLCHDLGLMALVCLEPVRMQQALEGDPSLAIADRRYGMLRLLVGCGDAGPGRALGNAADDDRDVPCPRRRQAGRTRHGERSQCRRRCGRVQHQRGVIRFGRSGGAAGDGQS